jgi:hypothetical protein
MATRQSEIIEISLKVRAAPGSARGNRWNLPCPRRDGIDEIVGPAAFGNGLALVRAIPI